MENIKEWVITLSGIIVFGSLCEMIVPTSNFQKYIRLVIGIILVLALMSPIYSFFKTDMPNKIFTADAVATYAHNSNDVEKYQKRKIISLYKEKLAHKILNSVLEDMANFSAEIKLEIEEGDEEKFGAVNRLVLLTETNYNSNEKEHIKKIITNEYGISENKIIVLHLLSKEK